MNHMISISPYGAGSVTTQWPLVGGAELAHPEIWLDGAQELCVFSNARSALWGCLRHLRLSESDEVCIQTTSNGPYISSCVTKTIESTCHWSRSISKNTKLIVVIHEFGFPCDEFRMRTLRCLGLPILEDCAYAVGSRISGAAVGRHGDYAVYSLSKYFPVPEGGLLVSRSGQFGDDEFVCTTGRRLSDAESWRTFDSIAWSPAVLGQWNATRVSNWHRFARDLAGLDVAPYFPMSADAIPGVFVCTLPRRADGEVLKNNFQSNGIEATQYYGHGGFYFPVHQFLENADVELMIRLFGESI